MIELDKIYNEDCLEGMKRIPDGSVDCIICDLTYGTTRNAWDSIIPIDKLWKAYLRVCKPNAAILLFSQQPFTSVLVSSNLKMFRYEWIWEKEQGTGHLNANKMPLKKHENILVFYSKTPTYNPQFGVGQPYAMNRLPSRSTNYGHQVGQYVENDGRRYPLDIIKFKHDKDKIHPTQKPVDLVAYLVCTYSNTNDIVLDNCSGSGTTAVACWREKRHFICFEKDFGYWECSVQRLQDERNKPNEKMLF